MASRFLTPLTRGFGMTKSKGFKESRSQGVKWFSWYLFFKTKRGKESEKRRRQGVGKERIQGVEESRGQVKKAEGWRVGGLEGWLNLYTSKLLIF